MLSHYSSFQIIHKIKNRNVHLLANKQKLKIYTSITMIEKTISLRINEELYKKMRMYDYINWSSFIRKYIQKQLENVEENSFNAKKASKTIDKLREAGAFKKGSKTGTEIIREWRDERKF